MVSPHGVASYAAHKSLSASKRQSRGKKSPDHDVLLLSGSLTEVKPSRSSEKATSSNGALSSLDAPNVLGPKIVFPPGPVRFVLPPAVAQEVLRGALSLDDHRTQEMMRKVARQEFKVIAKASRLPRTWAEKLALFPSATTFFSYAKNRYPKDVLATESTRVILKDVEHDYINANFINFSFGGISRFIACQAPIPSTMEDFWRMVWQLESCVIVMLTKFREKGLTKAHPYWPADIADPELVYGQIRVALVTQKVLGGLTINTLRLTWSPEARDARESELDALRAGGWRNASVRNLRTLEEDPESPLNASASKEGEIVRVVYHLHYTDWPDFGVPKTTRGIRHLVSYTNLYGDLGASQNLRGPIISHCSAGIGRTGTFIGIHVGISLIEAQLMPSVSQLVSEMRMCRFGMIQTDAQYVFVYEALNDHIQQHIEAKKMVRSTSHSHLSSSSKNRVPPQAPLSSRPWRSRSISITNEQSEAIVLGLSGSSKVHSDGED